MKFSNSTLNFAVGLLAFGTGVSVMSVSSFAKAGLENTMRMLSIDRVSASNQPQIPAEKTDTLAIQSLDINGIYHIKGNKPEGLEDFDWMEIAASPNESNSNESPNSLLNGRVETSTTFSFQKFHKINDDLYFLTDQISGAQYEFRGKYSRGSASTQNMLRGVLKKYVDGVAMIDTNVAFTWHRNINDGY